MNVQASHVSVKVRISIRFSCVFTPHVRDWPCTCLCIPVIASSVHELTDCELVYRRIICLQFMIILHLGMLLFNIRNSWLCFAGQGMNRGAGSGSHESPTSPDVKDTATRSRDAYYSSPQGHVASSQHAQFSPHESRYWCCCIESATYVVNSVMCCDDAWVL